MEKGVTFQHMHVVFGQSQCTVPVDQSEQSVLVGRRDFVETTRLREVGHRGPTIMCTAVVLKLFTPSTPQKIFGFPSSTIMTNIKKQ